MFFSTWETYHSHVLYLGYFNGPTGASTAYILTTPPLTLHRGSHHRLHPNDAFWRVRARYLVNPHEGHHRPRVPRPRLHLHRHLGPASRWLLLLRSPAVLRL